MTSTFAADSGKAARSSAASVSLTASVRYARASVAAYASRIAGSAVIRATAELCSVTISGHPSRSASATAAAPSG
jgi:hypothetical protein